MVKKQMMPYMDAVELLERYGISLPPYCMVHSREKAVETAVFLGFPVALKAISPELSHKSDMGLVQLGLSTPEAVQEAATSLLQGWQESQKLEGLLVQKMLPPGVEMIIGVHDDPQFGPVIGLGSGGVLVELLQDMVLRLPPLTEQQALAMIQETKSWRLLGGFRHYAAADVAALVYLLVNVSRLAASEEGIAGLDLNPVIVLPQGQGVGVVDIRIEQRFGDRE